PYAKQCLDEGDIEAVVQTLRGDWLTQGPKVAEFETALSEVTGAPYVVAVSNGTAALHLTCLAADLKPGDTGVTSAVTFVASANAIRYTGATPCLADINPETGLVSLQSLQRATKSPKVIIPVDLTGSVPDLAAIESWAQSIGAFVIEDAAHALGATYTHGGKVYNAASCTHTDMAILSFHPAKHITTGEGGAVCTRDKKLYEKLLELRTHGITRDPKKLTRNDGPWYHEQQSLGFNYRITDIQCALGLSQLNKLDGFIKRRREIAAKYNEAFEKQHLRVPAGVESAYHLYVIQVPERLRVYEELLKNKIGTQVHYIPVYKQPDYAQFSLPELPGAEQYYSGCLSLPMFPAMTDSDIHRVIETLQSILHR
ncbi:MAG: UDP-4-amino-4,6-dideoxy-N-acetyl-beta-L-altrosamine transaminase, partial [Myxococcaceae bacterium]